MRASWRAGFSFGLTSGVMTMLGVMAGLHAGTHSRQAVLGGIRSGCRWRYREGAGAMCVHAPHAGPAGHDRFPADLARRVLGSLYKDREGFIEMMRHAIAINGAFFNTQRMVGQYLRNAYRPAWQPSNGA